MRVEPCLVCSFRGRLSVQTDNLAIAVGYDLGTRPVVIFEVGTVASLGLLRESEVIVWFDGSAWFGIELSENRIWAPEIYNDVVVKACRKGSEDEDMLLIRRSPRSMSEPRLNRSTIWDPAIMPNTRFCA
jgi:hypothetical protein